MSEDKSAAFLYYWRLCSHGLPEPVAEYKFAEAITYRDKRGKERGRKYRFDHAFIEERIAIEVDGGQFSQFGGRHMTDTDREKQNCAAMLGWVVFHFSPQMLKRDPTHCIQQVRIALGYPDDNRLPNYTDVD